MHVLLRIHLACCPARQAKLREEKKQASLEVQRQAQIERAGKLQRRWEALRSAVGWVKREMIEATKIQCLCRIHFAFRKCRLARLKRILDYVSKHMDQVMRIQAFVRARQTSCRLLHEQYDLCLQVYTTGRMQLLTAGIATYVTHGRHKLRQQVHR